MTAARRPLRVAHIINSFHPRIGGLEMQAAALAREQLARGYEIEIVTRRVPGLRDRDHLNSIAVRRLGGLGPLGFVAAGLAHLMPARKTIDIVHAHSARAPALIGLLVRALGGPPLAVTLAGGDVPEPTPESRRLGPRAALRRAVLRRADAVVALTPAMAETLAALGIARARLDLIPNGVDTTIFHAPDEPLRRAARGRLAVPPDQPLVVFVGRLERVKGPDLLLAAWEQLERSDRTRRRDAWLLVAGDGSERPALAAQSRALDRVRILGRVEDQALLYQAADVAVVPSRSEGMSVSLLEAMACGVAVVATAVQGNRETVENGVTGLLAAPEAEAIASAIGALLDDAALRARLGEAAAATIRARFSLRAKTDAYEALYHRLVAEAR